MKVLIAGCGDLGTETALRLQRAGHQVVGLRRDPSVLPPQVTGLAGDLGASLPPLPADVDAVVFAAAPDERSADAYRRVYADGLTRVLDGLVDAGATPRRVLFVSSTAVYGVTDGGWVDETTPTEPASDTGRVLVETERRLLTGPFPGTTFRLAGIYGPGRTRLVDQVREGRASVPEPPVHANRIHRDDAAAAIVHLLTGTAPLGEVYLGVDHAPVDRGEVVRWLAERLGVPAPEPGPDRRSRGGDKRCRNDRLLGTGFAFTYPTYREGYAAVLAGQGTRHP
ncbi:SDR family oxidoreductase [Egicoccus halophilus]|uniref:NAD(P)-dependent oxidoreductase n=1 Tax=Egicoccus halophilus TaxID=1670830 RepID=A0A8J3A9H6_9ACTN|nr:SDR family oxidoreductase [Egicoccus halophilus]GGI08040.1 NAD(P)-dependent oxidoreductase [Egicoccus halophilus]